MRLTTKGRYAVTAILDLAIHSNENSVVLADISERQGISLSYLEQLFAKLKRAGLVNSLRGPGGGYRLGRSGDSIFISEVVSAVDESVDATRCQGAGNCQGGNQCLTHHLWCDLSAQIHNFLNGISLASLIERQEIKAIASRQDKEQQTTRMGEDYTEATLVLEEGFGI